MQPISITVDFEKAVISCLKDIFTGVQIYDCFFHFGQCLWRQIQACGLQSWYNDPKNAMEIKKIQELVFVPCDKVIDHFNNIMESFDEETDRILSDF